MSSQGPERFGQYILHYKLHVGYDGYELQSMLFIVMRSSRTLFETSELEALLSTFTWSSRP